MEHREIQLAASSKQLAEKRGKKKRIFLWERLSSRDFEVYIRLSQAELAPTEIILIDTRHVGATFGCEQGSEN
jgi:hypothetical protein